MSPGGRGGTGGMASVTHAMAGWFERAEPDRQVAVIDPRGGGRAILWPGYFVAGAARLIAARVGGARILHLQVSERSSFIRKGLLALAGRGLGMVVIMHHHGAELIPFFRTTSGPMRRWTRMAIHAADHNIVLGDRWRSFLESDVGLAHDRITVLPNAVPDQRIASDRSGAAADAQFRLLFLAQLMPRKGVGPLLAAMQLLKAEGVRIHLTLAGAGEIERYTQEAAALGVGEACSFLGWIGRDRVGGLMAAADAMVLPSFEEGLPMAILEALSQGLPVVATPVGSIPEVLTDGEDCLLVPPGDAGALAAALARLVRDPALRGQLSRNGRAQYERLFTMDAYMGRLLSTYAATAAAP